MRLEMRRVHGPDTILVSVFWKGWPESQSPSRQHASLFLFAMEAESRGRRHVDLEHIIVFYDPSYAGIFPFWFPLCATECPITVFFCPALVVVALTKDKRARTTMTT